MPPRPNLPTDLVEIPERWGHVQADATAELLAQMRAMGLDPVPA